MSDELRSSPKALRRRLVLAVTCVTLVTLGLAFAVVSSVVNSDQQRQLDEALATEARQEAQEAAQLGGKLAISDGPGPMANDIGPLTKYGAIYDEKGEVVAATETFHGKAPTFSSIEHPLGTCFNLWFAREHLRAILVPLPGHPGTHLLLAAPRFDLDADAAFLTRAMLLVWLVAVGWAMLVTTWIVRRLTRGHESIAEVARRVAKGDLSARIPDRASGPEMAQLAHDVNRMIERLSSLLTSQKEFIAHAAHELRSPLTALYGELSHALRRLRDAESYQHSIEEALDSTRRLKLLAEELLTLARLDATVDAARETVEPSRILQGAVRSVARCAEERGVAIVVEGETSARPIRGRAQDLERLFRNLLENAIRHSPPGGSIKVLLVDEPGGPFITVSDEGSGVKDADRDLIFEPFYRGSATRADDESGVGLGLAIARRIARAHGGDISLAAPGGALAGSGAAPGAQFIVRLRRDGE